MINPRHRSRVVSLTFALGFALGSPLASAQEMMDEDTSQALRGPAVSEATMQTLVRYDFRGDLVPVDGRPEEAAVALLVLQSGQADAVRELFTTRQTALGMHLVDEIERLRDAGDASRDGDNDTAQRIYREMWAAFDPDMRTTPVLEDLGTVLTEDQHIKLTDLVNDYWAARVDWELRNVDDVTDDLRAQTERQLAFQVFQREISVAYNWSLRPYRDKLELIYEYADVTEVQRTAIRDAIIEFVRESRLEPTAEQREATARAIYDLLSEEQRERVFREVLWRL